MRRAKRLFRSKLKAEQGGQPADEPKAYDGG